MSYLTLNNGEQLYYEDTEKGDQTILMLHGWSSSHKVYAEAVPEISRHARCVVYDHRGHGGSKYANQDKVTLDTLAGDLDQLIRGLGLKDIFLLGWSMGAATIMNYCALYGCDALRRVVLCDMTPKQINDDEWKLGLHKGEYTAETSKREEGMSFYALYKKFVRGTLPRLKKVPGFLLRRPLKKILSACDEQVLISLSRSLKEKDLRGAVEQITVPMTYFYAEPGSLYSPELAEWYRAHVRDFSGAVAFPDSTHMFVQEHPELFAKEVVKLLG